MGTQTKTCRKCGETKPLSGFYTKTRDGIRSESSSGYSSQCRECVRGTAAARRERLGQVHVDYMKDFDLRKKYGIGIEQYNKMFAAQKGQCVICGRHQTEFAKGLAVDHDHASGKIRQLLCVNCNNGLGCFMDSIGLLHKAVEYLQTHADGVSEPTASGKVAENGAEKGRGPMH
jgi:hypothetical protein